MRSLRIPAVLIAACGISSIAAGEEALLRILPENTVAIVQVDVRSLIESPLLKELVGLEKEGGFAPFAQLSQRLGIDVKSDVRALTLVFPKDADETKNFACVITGAFDGGRIVEGIKKWALEADVGPVKLAAHLGVETLILPKAILESAEAATAMAIPGAELPGDDEDREAVKEDPILALLDKERLVFGSRETVHACIALAKGEGRSLVSTALGKRAAAQAAAKPMIWVVATVPPQDGLKDEADEMQAMMMGPMAALRNIKAFDASAAVGAEAVEAKIVLHCAGVE